MTHEGKRIRRRCGRTERKDRAAIMKNMKGHELTAQETMETFYSFKPLPACGLCPGQDECKVNNGKFLEVLFP